jgi:acetyl-CoA carboxylase biotin carboxyl carrier protein
MGLTDDDVREILRIIDDTQLAELRIETKGFSLHVRKGAAPPGPVADEKNADDGLVTIESPMLGTFYRAEAPGAAPFVDLGAAVEPDTTVCIIEVMKMMNSVPAGVSGTIVEIAARNGELVEYGAPLFRVRAG